MLATIAHMNRVPGRIRGFTLIELIVVIAVIGILATITIVGFGRYQADTRDARRLASATAISEALEKYYDANGEYPSCSSVAAPVTAGTLSDQTLVGISEATLKAPQATALETNSIRCAANLTITGDDFFSYQGDGSTACTGSVSCLKFRLSYKKESDGTIVYIDSRRTANLATSGDITDLSASSSSFTSIALTWSAVQNATSYTLQRADNSAFTSGLVTLSTTLTTTSYSSTGLTAGNTYYYRIKPFSQNIEGNWSNTASAITRALSTPVVAAVTNAPTQITLSWPDIQNETSYTMQYTTSTNWTTPAPTEVANIPANTTYRVINGLTAGLKYYLRLKAVSSAGGGDQSDWSNTATVTTSVPAPAGISANAGYTTLAVSWSSVSVADTYKLQYSTVSNFSSALKTVTGITGTSRTITGLNQGDSYYVRVYAMVGSASSGASPTGGDTTAVAKPDAPSISAHQPDDTRSSSSGGWIRDPGGSQWYYAYAEATDKCPANTTPLFRFRAEYSADAAGTPGPGDPVHTDVDGSTRDTWYMIRPTATYRIKFGAQNMCKSPQGIKSVYSNWASDCAGTPVSNVSCNW